MKIHSLLERNCAVHLNYAMQYISFVRDVRTSLYKDQEDSLVIHHVPLPVIQMAQEPREKKRTILHTEIWMKRMN